MMVLSCASNVRRGEQFGVIAMLYNKTPKEILVLLSVPHSDDYVFVHVGKHGQLEFNKDFPRFSSGEHQHLVWVNNMMLIGMTACNKKTLHNEGNYLGS
jgi:hypothetical protein